VKKLILSNCLAALFFSSFFAGCSRTIDLPGTSVTLQTSDYQQVGDSILAESKESMAWDKKSFALQREGKYEEAAYCLNQAHAKYPSKDPRPEGNRKIPWLEADQAFA
jgi:hypothetical protein